ncbi:MAG: CRISPR-associated helicase Cas3' [Thermodesulfovibrionales bacterium]
MVKTLLSSNLYSHPGILLEDHLIGVAELSDLFLSEKPSGIKEKLNSICKVIALTHDIGKATRYFQDYLNATDKEKERIKKNKETWHSLFSSVCAYYLTKELFLSDEICPVFAFLAIRRHHGNLRDVRDDVLFDDRDAELLHKQLKSIADEGFSVLCSRLHSAGLPLLLNKQIISQWINDFANESRQIKKNLRNINNSISNYITINLIYSILLDADKSEVVVKDKSVFNRKEFYSTEWVRNFKEQTIFPESPVNILRERAYQETLNSDIDLNKKIYSLNLPTGLGKTLTSLYFALKLKEVMKSENDVAPRIVYTLPFLSIIDQNSEVFESVIKTNNIEPDTSILLKHHHLSEVFYKKEDVEFESDEAKILIEGWNSEIIVTTFVQLFHTLISNKNRSIRKFHRLSNSIIILDEVQSIPVKYWLLLRNVLMNLSEMLNAYIVFVTATEPLIFERDETTGLINKDNYFTELDRVTVKPLLNSTMTINELSGYFDLTDEKTYLFIFNTITSAKDFYYLVKNKGITITYLSTHLIPKERLKRIREIKEKKYKVVVTTQVVEAGVDIDFDVVVRDMAPMDSINQASGRCNRNGNSKGETYIVKLANENGRKYASYIYDAVLLDITDTILSTKDAIKEGEFLNLIDHYYRETKEKKTQDVSRNLMEAITKLRYDSEDDTVSISDFQLIEEDYQKIDIFIEVNEDAGKVWKKFMDLRSIDDLFLRKKTFDAMKAEFYQYVISIPKNTKNMPHIIGEMGYVKQSIIDDYYDSETGFITKDTKSVVIW